MVAWHFYVQLNSVSYASHTPDMIKLYHYLAPQPSDTHLPSSASIQLPQVHVEAELIQDDAANTDQHAGKHLSSYFCVIITSIPSINLIPI